MDDGLADRWKAAKERVASAEATKSAVPPTSKSLFDQLQDQRKRKEEAEFAELRSQQVVRVLETDDLKFLENKKKETAQRDQQLEDEMHKQYEESLKRIQSQKTEDPPAAVTDHPKLVKAISGNGVKRQKEFIKAAVKIKKK